jgi:hypothetical protein
MWAQSGGSTALIALLAPLLLAAGGLVIDHGYTTYAEVLARHVRMPRVDYAALKADCGRLDRAVAEFSSPAAAGESGWSRKQRMAFWINAYNAFTLRAIIDHYPINGSWFSLHPRNSIRQIDGVWTRLKWQAAWRTVTLDDIEHRILRPTFGDPRIHFAVNCASISCPPLVGVPYRAESLDVQLNEAARQYLAGAEGLDIEGETLLVSSIFDWYGGDFVPLYESFADKARDTKQRAILGVVIKYGPPAAVQLARSGRARLDFLDYNWTLNDIAR